MSRIGLLVLCIFAPSWVHAAVVVNEIAWMGTAASANAEWLELANTDGAAVDLSGWHLIAANGSPSIALTGSIPAQGYYLLERTSDASVLSVTADFIFTGALTNSGTTLTLTNGNGTTIDQVIGGANWSSVGGDNVTKDTAQRTASGWTTAAGTPRAINAGVSPATTNTNSTASITSANTSATTTPQAGGGPVEYIPIPTLRIVTSGDRSVSSGADTAFTAVVYDGKGNKRDEAIVAWSFGDGMRRTGASVFHTYYEPGEYVVVIRATTSDGGDVSVERILTAKEAKVNIVSVSTRGVSLANNSTRTINLSFWRLRAGDREFKIPEDTHVLAGRTILFPSQIIQLPLSGSAELLYPGGEIAASYPTVAPQPLTSPISFNPMQTSNTITSASPNIQTHEDAVIAPGAAVKPAAPGAAAVAAAPAPEGPRKGLFSSPWTYGLLGVIAIAGGAFILL